jgi:predicted TIM-barrel fold metal-dependent hydrolase
LLEQRGFELPVLFVVSGAYEDSKSQRGHFAEADSSAKFDFPVEYMFKNVPKELYGASKDPISVTLHEMDRFGIEMGLIGVGGEITTKAVKDHPDRFIPMGNVDPNRGMDGIRHMVRQHEDYGVRAFGAFNAGYNPQVGLGDPLMYPIYAKCVELGVPIFACAGVPGPRFPMWPQEVRLIDRVMYDFPELVFVRVFRPQKFV